MLFFVQSCCCSCVSVGERSLVSECVSKHRLWVANGARSSCCVPHFRSPASICGVFGAVRSSSSSLLLLLLLCSRTFMRWVVVQCCRLPAALPLSPGTASWCVKGTKCLNNSVCQKSISSAAVIAVLRWLVFDETVFTPLSIPTCTPVWWATFENLCGSDAAYFDVRVAEKAPWLCPRWQSLCSLWGGYGTVWMRSVVMHIIPLFSTPYWVFSELLK